MSFNLTGPKATALVEETLAKIAERHLVLDMSSTRWASRMDGEKRFVISVRRIDEFVGMVSVKVGGKQVAKFGIDYGDDGDFFTDVQITDATTFCDTFIAAGMMTRLRLLKALNSDDAKSGADDGVMARMALA